MFSYIISAIHLSQPSSRLDHHVSGAEKDKAKEEGEDENEKEKVQVSDPSPPKKTGGEHTHLKLIHTMFSQNKARIQSDGLLAVNAKEGFFDGQAVLVPSSLMTRSPATRPSSSKISVTFAPNVMCAPSLSAQSARIWS